MSARKREREGGREEGSKYCMEEEEGGRGREREIRKSEE
jgi:hypothetical protein